MSRILFLVLTVFAVMGCSTTPHSPPVASTLLKGAEPYPIYPYSEDGVLCYGLTDKPLIVESGGECASVLLGAYIVWLKAGL